jgi:hypothetical protein
MTTLSWRTWSFVCALAIAGGGAALECGCGGDSGTGAGGGDDGGGIDGTSGTDGSGNGDGTTGNDGGNDGGTGDDGGPGNEGGPPICIRPDGGAPSNPSSVECGGQPCSVPTNVCCDRFWVDGGVKCQPAAQQCQGPTLACDEKADCPTGQVCCLIVNGGNGGFATECRQTCPGAELCRCDQDCPQNTPCNVLTCPGNRHIEACGQVQGCQ